MRGKKKYVVCVVIGAFLYLLSVFYKSSSSTEVVNFKGISDVDEAALINHEIHANQQLKIKESRKGNGKVVDINVASGPKHGDPISFNIEEKRPVPFCSSKTPVLESVISAPEYVFQPLSLGSSLLYVYSAFYDRRNQGLVRVIATLNTRQSPAKFFCQLWYRVDKQVMFAAPAQFLAIPEGSGRIYTAGMIQCTNPSTETPYAVSIVQDSCQHPDNVLKLLDIEAPSDKPMPDPLRITTCITPLNLNYDKVHQLVEYLEVSKLLGANHFIFYNYTSSARVTQILNQYRDIVTILPWHLPMKVHVWPIPAGYVEDIKYFGQMAALNDCLYRAMYLKFNLAVFADLDELLIPRKDNTWAEMFNRLGGGLASSYVFRNTFFKTEWEDDPVTGKDPQMLALKAMTMLKTKREHTINPVGSRSKLIVRPEKVQVMGVHNIWTEAAGGTGGPKILDPEDGMCHHYRFWEGMGEKTWVVDQNVWRLKDPIVNALTKAYAELKAAQIEL